MYRTIKNLLVLALIAGITACGGDNSTGPDPSEAPEPPQVQSEEAQPDISFFENNEPKMVKGESLAETNNYYAAGSWATLHVSTFAFASTYNSFLVSSNNEEAVYEDGMWVWEYSYQGADGSFTMRMTSEEVADGYKWAVYWSIDDGETSIENYKLMEGTVSEDGSEGSWTFNSLDSGSGEERVAYTSEWTVTSETESSMTAKWYDESGATMLTADYDKNEPEHTIVYTDVNSSDVTLFWNTETNVGSYEEDGETRCWDENFQDIACS